jgi:tetratricopeptide (TPR) repeat protein/predicted Ser/Thr protein kinase
VVRGRSEETEDLTVPEAPAASEPATRREPASALQKNLGRYLVIEEIGAGGMGLVLRAYDPKLGREVAVKRLRLAERDGSTGSARMMREAQAMAKLSHPNVVPVYDVDVDDGMLFIAMEYVQGDTLRDWLRRAPRSWAAIVEVFVAAGRGLAAAHAQGIVHRDFKPSNVLVGDDGRVRVMDFGLARSVDEADAPASASAASISARSHADLAMSLTEHGTVMGTPSYMAPEQHAGRPTDPRTDQYAFGTALWEALHGRTPFRADDLASLAAAKNGPLPKPPAGTKVPARVHAVVVRALAVDPQDRFAGMDALLSALQRAAAPRRPWLALVPAALATAGVVAFVMADRGDVCAHAESALDEVWGDAAHDAVRDALLSSSAAHAAATWERAGARLDAYAAEWTAMHRDACEATHVRKEQSGEAFDLRMACLAELEQGLGAVVDVLSSGSADATQQAIELSSSLSPVARCADVAALRDRAPPAAAAEAVRAARSQIGRARVQADAGAVDDALATAHAAREAALAIDHPPLHAEADVRLGAILSLAGKDDEATPLLEGAMQTALRHHERHAAAEAAVALTHIATRRHGRSSEGQWLAKVALGLSEGDGTDVSLVATAMLQVGAALVDEERRDEAEPFFRGAVDRVEQQLGAEHPDLVGPLLSWTSFLVSEKRYDEAETVGQRALSLAETAFGPAHPQTGEALQQLGWLMIIRRRPEEAKAAYDRALAIAEGAFGADHPEVWSIMGRRAAALAEQGMFDDAAASLEDGLSRMDATLPADHRARASTLHNLARVRGMQGDHARAVELYGEANAMRRRLGVKSDLVAGVGALAEELYALGRLDEAEQSFRETWELVVAMRPEGPHSGMAFVWLGRIEHARGNPSAALVHLEAAWALERDGPDDLVKVETAYELGRTLWDAGEERARARRLVEMARDALARAEGDDAQLRERIAAWLAGHTL